MPFTPRTPLRMLRSRLWERDLGQQQGRLDDGWLRSPDALGHGHRPPWCRQMQASFVRGVLSTSEGSPDAAITAIVAWEQLSFPLGLCCRRRVLRAVHTVPQAAIKFPQGSLRVRCRQFVDAAHRNQTRGSARECVGDVHVASAHFNVLEVQLIERHEPPGACKVTKITGLAPAQSRRRRCLAAGLLQSSSTPQVGPQPGEPPRRNQPPSLTTPVPIFHAFVCASTREPRAPARRATLSHAHV